MFVEMLRSAPVWTATGVPPGGRLPPARNSEEQRGTAGEETGKNRKEQR
jgi:hypothetical protein